MKIAYLGFDFFYGCLESVLESGHNVYKVFTFDCDNKYNFNLKLCETANRIGAEVIFSQITSNDIYKLIEEDCDLIISAGYPYKIPIFKQNMPYAINIHPTLLPEGKGPWPLPWIILHNLEKSGVTIHKLSEKLDSGDILIQRQYDVSQFDDLETISCKSQIMAAALIKELLTDFTNLWEAALPQKGYGTYWNMPELTDRTLDWSNDIHLLKKISRAFGKFDSCAVFDNKEWIVKDLSVWESAHSHPYGTVVHRTNNEVVIAAKNGFACLRFFEIDPDCIEGDL